MRPLLRLRRFIDQPAAPAERPESRCEMCAAAIGPRHSHVIDAESRRLMCACRPCYLLFTHSGAAGGRYRSVGERCIGLPECSVLLEGADIPVGIAFFLRNSAQNRVLAFYPSPAGATESGLPVEVWDEAVRSQPVLDTLEADVEALLIRGGESWIVPVDACYELVGRIRRCWKGFDGGEEAKQEIEAFFAELRQREQRSTPCRA